MHRELVRLRQATVTALRERFKRALACMSWEAALGVSMEGSTEASSHSGEAQATEPTRSKFSGRGGADRVVLVLDRWRGFSSQTGIQEINRCSSRSRPCC